MDWAARAVYRVVFIDVDDTLVRSVGSKRIPNPPLIKTVRALHAEGAVLYLWSTGVEYAKIRDWRGESRE